MSGYIIRFFSFLFSYVLFPASLKGKESIPLDRPSIFIVPQIFWPWASVLLASQRRRVRLLTMKASEEPPFFARIARRLIPILVIHDLKELMPGKEHEETVRHALERGTSVALFCTKKILQEQMKEFVAAWSQDPIAKSLPFFIVSVPEEGSIDAPKLGDLSLSAHIEQIQTFV